MFVSPRAVSLFPQAKAPQEGVGVISCAATGWQRFHLVSVPPAETHILGFQGGDQTFHRVSDVVPPLLLAVLLQASSAHVILESGLFVRQVPQLHWFHTSIH